MLASSPVIVCPCQPPETNSWREIAFIDATLNDYRVLVSGVRSGVETVVLRPNRNGVETITQVLKTRPGINTVHLVSQGSPGSIQLGNAVLSLATLERYTWDLAIWADQLATDAELLIYGCEVGDGEPGEEFIFQLSQITGTKVATSRTKTGSAALGGNWELALRTGDIKASCALIAEVRTSYRFLLQ